MNQTEVFALIKQFTGQANVLTVPVGLIRYTGGIDCALFLGQVIYWTGKTKNGWFYKSVAEWKQELGLTNYAIRKATKTLTDKGILETKLRKVNGAPTLFYHLKTEEFSKSIMQFSQNGFFEISESIDFAKCEQSINSRLPETTYTDLPAPLPDVLTFQNPNQHSPVAKKSKRVRARDYLFDALADVCRVNPVLMTAEQRGAMNQTLGKLREAARTPEEVKNVGAWWYRFDWRGKRGQAPRPHEIREVWDQAFAPLPIADEHPNAYRPGKMIL